jgi:hypothetical protein
VFYEELQALAYIVEVIVPRAELPHPPLKGTAVTGTTAAVRACTGRYRMGAAAANTWMHTDGNWGVVW